MTIMVILSGVAIVSLRGSQANARDSKRVSDVDSIARSLETRYDRGMQQPTGGATVSLLSGASCTTTTQITSSDALSPGAYPSIVEMQYVMGGASSVFCPSQTTNFITDDLPGINRPSLQPPNSGIFTTICASACGAAENTSTVNTATSGANLSNYVYEPIDRNNNVCYNLSQDCVRYNLYYRTEKNSSQPTTVRSRHQ